MQEVNQTWDQLFNIPMIERILAIAIGIAVVLFVTYILRQTLNKRIKSTENKYKARKAVNFMGYLLMLIVILFVYSDKLGSIGVTIGVIGAGIAFALQEVIISLAGWLNIIMSGVVGVGDRVKIGEVKGDIIDIGILSTVIMEVGDWVDGDLYNGRIVTIANSFVFKENIHNYSGEYPFLWDEITIPIRTESDYHLARKVFTETLNSTCEDYALSSKGKWQELTNKYQVEEARVEPIVSLQFDENWITFTLRYIVDYKKRRSTKDKIYTNLLDKIAQYDDIIMIATSTMEIKNIISKEDHMKT